MAFLWDFEAYTCMGTRTYLLTYIDCVVLLLPLLLLLLVHPLNVLFSRTTWVSLYQKSKTSPDLKEARDKILGWQ